MPLDPLIPTVVAIIFVVLLTTLALRLVRQPNVVAYIIAGILIGPHVLAIVEDRELVEHLGGLGVLFLLFFVGLELRPRDFIAAWRAAFLGVLMQVLLCVLVVWLAGQWLDWALPRILLLGFVICLSSTAVIARMLEVTGDAQTRVGRDMLSLTIAQDLAIVPMLILLGIAKGGAVDPRTLVLQGVGAVLLVVLLVATLRPDPRLPRWLERLTPDRDFRVLMAMLLCFGLALLSLSFHLSAALGSFVAGMVASSTGQTEWVKQALEPFRVVLVGLFFVSVGMLVDVRFALEHWVVLAGLLVLVIVVNTLVNTVVMRWLDHPWRQSLYAGAALAQIGEFSFVLAAIGVTSGIISDFSYQTTISIIALSLLVAPPYMLLVRRLALGGKAGTEAGGSH